MKVGDKYNNSYHFILEIEPNPEAPKFKVCNRVSVAKYKNIFRKVYPGNWSREIFFVDSVLKNNTWTHKIKDLNWEKVIGSFYEKNLCWVNYE